MFRRGITGLVVVVLMFSITAQTEAQTRCFPADVSPHCLSEPFSGYWESNGGLPVFGYPITTVAREVNRDTGETYRTQWLERNRFELHPENTGTPYEVMLGLLGKERLAQMGRDWASEGREDGPKRGCLWFEQTGHNVCNQQGQLGFKTYWETHGLSIDGLDAYARSLQLFGLPLTSPAMERNAAGDLVLTQWFERARFEWHPSNSNEYKVLLGLLGGEVHGSGGGGGAPTPEPVPVNESCLKDAPAQRNGAQVWVTRSKVAASAQQTICARLTSQDKARPGVSVTLKVEIGSNTTNYIGITDNSGIAKVPFNVGSTRGKATVTATFTSGEQAQTTFTIQ